VAAIVTVVGSYFAPQPGGEDPAEPCAVVIRNYKEIVAQDGSMVKVLTKPHSDGKPIIQSDEDAVRCHVDGQALKDMAPS
jgi:hypothetical protein